MNISDIRQQDIDFGNEEAKNLGSAEMIVPEVELIFSANTVSIPDFIISNSEMVADFIRSLYQVGIIELQERFTVLFLNRKNKVIGYYKHTVGSHTATLVDNNIILSAAIQSLSSSIILSHNHPSGNTQPSKEDINLTDRLKEQFKPFSITILDHVIVTKDSYYSFADEGALYGINDLSGVDEGQGFYEGIPFLTEQEEMELGVEVDYTLGKTGGRDTIYKMINERIINLIKDEKNLFWRKTWINEDIDDGDSKNSMEFARSFSTGKLYSGINFWMVNIAHKEENGKRVYFLKKTNQPFWLTPKQIREQGGQIKKGAKTEIIIYYIKHYSLFGKGSSAEYYRQIMQASGKNPNDKRCEGLNAYSAMKYYRVINQKDVSGIDFEKKAPKIKRRKPLNDDQKVQASELVIKLMPNAPKIEYGGASASYNSIHDLVRVPKSGQFENINEYYGAIFHELVHSTGHKSRLTRTLANPKSSKEYAFEELIAELGASYLNAESGILFENLKNSSAYIKSWNSRLVKEMEEDFSFFFKASSQAQKAANYILDIDQDGEPKFYEQLKPTEAKPNVKTRIRANADKIKAKEKKTKAMKLKANALKLKLKLVQN